MTVREVQPAPASLTCHGPELPTRADLDAATAATRAAIDDPWSPTAQAALETEQQVHLAYLLRPGADAELQADAELEAAIQ
jgi:hypothetical protein